MSEELTKGEAACVSLKAHFDCVLEQIEKRYNQRFEDQREAVKIALEALKTGPAASERIQNLLWRLLALGASLAALYFAQIKR